MATVYKQLQQYQKSNKAQPLSEQLLKDLGALICKIWFDKPQSKNTKLGRAVSVEPSGTFTVISYPKYFAPEIDRAIHYYYKTIVNARPGAVVKPMRKRIPVSSKPVFQSKRTA